MSGVVQFNDPTDAQRTTAARLVGWLRRTGSTLRVELADVEAILRRGPWPAGLSDAAETLTGPVVDLVELAAAVLSVLPSAGSRCLCWRGESPRCTRP